MTRILLALLALLGFAAQAAPAEAAGSCGVGSAEVGALTIGGSQAHAVVAQAQRFIAPASRQTRLAEVTPLAFPRLAAVFVPTVLTGIDRARE